MKTIKSVMIGCAVALISASWSTVGLAQESPPARIVVPVVVGLVAIGIVDDIQDCVKSCAAKSTGSTPRCERIENDPSSTSKKCMCSCEKCRL